ncbi:MAG: glycosyltransferase family 4 protein [Deltaproteobacteria bacterium]|nr:glycosyltransferase family 4 protein [Candidatus Deferrimicrobium borealis]
MSKNRVIKVLYIWDADYPWDVRVEKVCNSLADNGYEVHIAARNLKKLPIYELVNKFHVHRMTPRNNDYMNYVLSFPAFFSPYWKNFIDGIIEEVSINIIIVRDLPMAAAGILAGKRHNIPIIFDMAEDYCAMIREIWNQNKYHRFNLVVRNPYFAKFLEKYVLKKFDHIMVVVEEAKNMVIEKGVDKDRITVVGNTPLLNITKNKIQIENEHIKIIKERYAIIYTGGITFDRGISVVLEAIPNINHIIQDLLFVIVGRGDYTAKILDIIDKQQLHRWVLLTGWVDHENLYNYINSSKVGIIPHYVTDHIRTTIPNKLFDYMACGIPVIASDAPPLRRIILEEKCGMVFDSGNSKDLSEMIIKMYLSKDYYGANGQIAFENKYNWKEDEKKLINIVKSIQQEYHI